MKPNRPRLPYVVLGLAVLIGILLSGGSVLLVVLLWLAYRAWRRGRLRSCLTLGCAGWLVLAILIAAVQTWGPR